MGGRKISNAHKRTISLEGGVSESKKIQNHKTKDVKIDGRVLRERLLDPHEGTIGQWLSSIAGCPWLRPQGFRQSRLTGSW